MTSIEFSLGVVRTTLTRNRGHLIIAKILVFIRSDPFFPPDSKFIQVLITGIFSGSLCRLMEVYGIVQLAYNVFRPCPREFQDVLLPFLLLVRAVLLRRRFGPVQAFIRVVTASNQ